MLETGDDYENPEILPLFLVVHDDARARLFGEHLLEGGIYGSARHITQGRRKV